MAVNTVASLVAVAEPNEFGIDATENDEKNPPAGYYDNFVLASAYITKRTNTSDKKPEEALTVADDEPYS